MKLRIYVSYVGTAYCGYQVQPNGVSIQQMLNRAAEEVFGFPCDIVGCSRTDAGVHAFGFCATVSKRGEDSLVTAIPTERIPLALSAHLPEDIRVYDADFVDEGFHARYGVLEKEYRYFVWNAPILSPFKVGRAYHFPRRISDGGLEAMQKAALLLCGTHDFSSFMAQGSKVVSTVRTIRRFTVAREGDKLVFSVSADGFLYNMVRILVGTLLEIGERKRSPEEIPAILEARDRNRAGSTAPACGLYLWRVTY